MIIKTKQVGVFHKQVIEGKFIFEDEDKIRLNEVTVENVGTNFKFMLDILDIEKNKIEKVVDR